MSDTPAKVLFKKLI